MKKLKVALIGNPNSGKSTLFSFLSGKKQCSSNWPGVTVEKKCGEFTFQNIKVEIIDLPGIYSLNQSNSIDEKIAFNFLLDKDFDIIINVVDATNLSRHLYLTLQLLEMQIPTIIALNMCDVLNSKSLRIDINKLSAKLQTPTLLISAKKKIGIDDLKIAAINYSQHQNNFIDVAFDGFIKDFIDYISVEKSINQAAALRLIETEDGIESHLKKHLIDDYQEDIELIIVSKRYEFINNLLGKVLNKPDKIHNFQDKLDRILLNKYIGLPIFFILIYCMFTFSIVFGGAFQDFFELTSEALFVDMPKLLMYKLGFNNTITYFIINCIGGAIQTVLSFVPVIAGLYIFISILEDSGYMARAALLIDKLMRKIGLSGKAFFPLIIGFGCNVPSILAMRILSDDNQRKAAIMMAPFMSCGARLSVYALFCAAFFPKNGQNIVFLLYLIGLLFAVVTGLIMKKILNTKQDHLVLELPMMQLPTLKSICIKTYDKVYQFVFGAGKLIVIVFVLLQSLNMISISNDNQPLITYLGKKITPLFSPMGIKENNWPASVGIFTGIFAKEVVVGTLNSLYHNQLQDDSNIPQPLKKLQEAILSIADNLVHAKDNLLRPLWLNVSDQEIVLKFLNSECVKKQVLTTMREQFGGTLPAFTYMLFILLYFPCISVFGTIASEIGVKWAIYSALWSTSLAFMVSMTFYQIALRISLEDICAFIFIGLVMKTIFSMKRKCTY